MLETTVSRALGHEATLVGDWTVVPIKYDAFNPVSAGLYRVSGTARSASATGSWGLVVKICHEPQEEWLARLPPDRRAAELDFLRWDREAEAYESGLLETLPRGLVAPRCFGVERDGASARIWLEDVRDEFSSWDTARYALAARHLGRFNGEYLTTKPLPDQAWLSRRWIQGWVAFFTRNAATQLADDRIWAAPLTLELFGPSARDELRRTLAALDGWWAALDRLPVTLGHLDAFRANLLSRVTRGQTETVAVDWAFVGIAPLAADMTQLVLASIFYHGERLEPAALAEACLGGYDRGLRDVGCVIAPGALRRAYVINAITRWLFIFGPFAAVGQPAREAAVAEARGKPYRDVLTTHLATLGILSPPTLTRRGARLESPSS